MLRDRERRHIETFRAVMGKGFPVGWTETPAPPAPDVLVHTADRVVGIEHTELVLNRSVRARERERDRVIAEACRQAEAAGVPPVQVIFSTSGRRFLKAARETAPPVLASLVAEHLPAPGSHVSLDWMSLYRRPAWDYVTSVSIHRHAGMTRHQWHAPEVGVVHEAVASLLQSEIDRKANALPGYRTACDECWLLVAAETLRSSGMVEPDAATREARYRLPFDRVYFLDATIGACFELRSDVA